MLDFFHKKAGKKGDGSEAYEKWKNKLQKDMKSQDDVKIESNQNRQHQQNQQILIDASRDLNNKVMNGYYGLNTMNEFVRDYNEVIRVYNQEAKGLKTTSQLADFIREKNTNFIQTIVESLKEKFLEQADIIDTITAELKQKGTSSEKLIALLNKQKESLQRDGNALQNEKTDLQDQVFQLKEEQAREMSDLRNDLDKKDQKIIRLEGKLQRAQVEKKRT